MADVIVGAEDGVYRLAEGNLIAEADGPPDVRYLTRAASGSYAITSAGALWGRADGGDWRLVHERPVPDEIWSLGADVRLAGRLYLGVSPALLYRSDDDGRHWTACESLRAIPGYETWTFPPPPHIPHVRSIAADLTTPGAVYIGVEEGGVYRSPDGGEHWQSLNDGLYWDVHTITPVDGDRLYATTGGGFYRSDNGGAHWRHAMTGLEHRYTVPFVTSPQNAGLLFTAAAATPPPGWRANGPNPGIYRSDDGGEHWALLTDGLPARFTAMVTALVHDAGGALYAAAGGDIYRSDDAGAHWRSVAQGLPPVRALLAV